MTSRHRRVVAGSYAIGLALALCGCDEGPPTNAELDAISAMQRAHAHVEMDEKGHAIAVMLAHVPLRDSDLAPLKDLPDLEDLNLDATPIGDEGAAHLGGLKRLKHLSLRGTNVTDAGLAHLKGLSSLEELDLERLKITDAGLQQLSSIASLRKVYVGPGGPTSAGKDALQSANPNIRVFKK